MGSARIREDKLLLLTPAEIFNFSLAHVCQTMKTEISPGCNCAAPGLPTTQADGSGRLKLKRNA